MIDSNKFFKFYLTNVKKISNELIDLYSDFISDKKSSKKIIENILIESDFIIKEENNNYNCECNTKNKKYNFSEIIEINDKALFRKKNDER